MCCLSRPRGDDSAVDSVRGVRLVNSGGGDVEEESDQVMLNLHGIDPQLVPGTREP